MRIQEQNGLALVLAGGGARAAYQAGALAGIAERAGSMRGFPIVTGVSAGAINAATLTSCQDTFAEAVRRLERAWLGMSLSNVFRTGSLSLLAGVMRWGCMLATGGKLPALGARGLLNTKPLRRTLSGYISSEGIDGNVESGRLRALALSATSYASGRTVTFVHGNQSVPTWERKGRVGVRARISVDHTLASSALPLIFPAIPLGNEHFGDGSIRQLAPLAPAIHLGATRMLVVSMRHPRGRTDTEGQAVPGRPPPAQILGMLMNAVFLDSVETDAERLERVNRTLAARADRPHPEGLRQLELFVLRPSRDLGTLAAGLDRYLPPALKHLTRSLGSSGLRSQDLLSYLLFERPYIERLIELGRADALTQWDGIAPILG